MTPLMDHALVAEIHGAERDGFRYGFLMGALAVVGVWLVVLLVGTVLR